MGRLSASLLVLLLGAAATVALASCGSSDSGLLPGSTASEINSNLDEVQQLVAEGDCAGAETASAEISGQIENLGGVNSRLKEALGEGAARLADVVSSCEEVPDEEEELKDLEAQEEEQAEEQEADEKKEKKEKPDKQKPEKEKEQKEPPVEQKEPPTEEESTPPEETGGGGTPSGGVGPAAPAGGE